MATLVLTSVGTLVGGPLGGAVGAILGQAIDGNLLFKPKGRQGPRLNELTVQTSSYGTSIPTIFGTMRVAGTVFWSTDLREERTRTGGGKGRPSVTNYSYSASFAVLLSGRPVREVRRIWADGNLMRGAAGDWKVATRFRLHAGGEDQAADPMIAAAEGAARTPAQRGCAYAVFEDLDLGPYGNRIPSLTFEVVADDGAASIARIVREASDGRVSSTSDTVVQGFAGGGDSVRGLIETLTAAVPMTLTDDGVTLRLEPAASAVAHLAAAECIGRRTSKVEGGSGSAPEELAVGYLDSARDYQAGLQRARRGPGGRRTERLDLPIVLSAGEAKAIAQDRLERVWRERQRLRLALPWRRLDLAPGDCVTVEGEGGSWRIAGWTLEEMRLELDLVRQRIGAALNALPASPGRNLAPPDLVHGETRLVLVEPRFPDAGEAGPRVFAAAAGGPGWRSAALLASTDGGQSFDPAGATAAPAVIGTLSDVLQPGPTALIDHVNMLEVVLHHADMQLGDADMAALLAGRNLAAVGEEMIQFGLAEPLGAGRWRVRELLRGRLGTEAAVASHGPGESFVLIERQSLAAIAVPDAAIGGEILVLAAGPGDPLAGTRAARSEIGQSRRPLAPAHLVAAVDGAGGWRLGWTRRSRVGWAWIDEVDTPVGEATERYRVVIATAAGTEVFETQEPRLRIAADAEATVTVQQIGDHGLSAPTTLRLDTARRV